MALGIIESRALGKRTENACERSCDDDKKVSIQSLSSLSLSRFPSHGGTNSIVSKDGMCLWGTWENDGFKSFQGEVSGGFQADAPKS